MPCTARACPWRTCARPLAGANAFCPKGHLENEDTSWTVVASDQLRTAAQYRKVIVAERDGVTIRLGDVATVTDSSQDIRQMALSNGKPSILLIVFRSPGANIIETVDRVKAMIPQLRSWLPESADLSVRMDRSQTIRASLHEVEKSLLLSMALVVLVVFLFFCATAAPPASRPWPRRYRSSAPSGSCICAATPWTTFRSWP